MIKTLLATLVLMLPYTTLYAATTTYPLDRAPYLVNDLTALQNGAKLFIHHCLSCHSAQAMRYNKLRDIGLTERQIQEQLLFTDNKINDPMQSTMSPADAKKWFGITPPDLSVIARAKANTGGPSGADYIYTYLRSFYRDVARPTGWNNLTFPDTAMPHALWQRQGSRELTVVTMQQSKNAEGTRTWERVTTLYDAQGFSTTQAEPVPDFHGHAGSPEVKFKPQNPVQAATYDRDVADLAAFMTWMAEPVQRFRVRLGVVVVIFLGLFMVVAWRLNATYWKHVR